MESHVGKKRRVHAMESARDHHTQDDNLERLHQEPCSIRQNQARHVNAGLYRIHILFVNHVYRAAYLIWQSGLLGLHVGVGSPPPNATIGFEAVEAAAASTNSKLAIAKILFMQSSFFS